MGEQQPINQPTIDNADDAYLEAKARFDDWMSQFQANWYKPQAQTAARMLWSRQPEQVKDMIRQSKPEAARKMDDLISERK